jgi:chromosome segregation ATPase
MSAAKEQILVATNTQAETEKTINDLKQLVTEKEQALSDVKLSEQKLRREVETHPQVVANIQQTLDQRTAELEQWRKDSTTRVDALNQQLAELKQASAEQQKALTEAQSTASVSQGQVEQLQAALRQTEEKLAAEQSLRAQLETKD